MTEPADGKPMSPEELEEFAKNFFDIIERSCREIRFQLAFLPFIDVFTVDRWGLLYQAWQDLRELRTLAQAKGVTEDLEDPEVSLIAVIDEFCLSTVPAFYFALCRRLEVEPKMKFTAGQPESVNEAELKYRNWMAELRGAAFANEYRDRRMELPEGVEVEWQSFIPEQFTGYHRAEDWARCNGRKVKEARNLIAELCLKGNAKRDPNAPKRGRVAIAKSALSELGWCEPESDQE